MFGNPNRAALLYLKKETYLDTLLPELNNCPYPSGDSQEAVDEINQLIKLTNSIEEDLELQKRYGIYDENLEGYIANVLSKNGVSLQDIQLLMSELFEDITPLMAKIQFSYQRLLPSQLAGLLQMSLYPYPSASQDTPPYPSRHVLQANIYCEILGNRYPKYYKQLKELAKDIYDSRMALGLNYQSDCEFAVYVYESIMQHTEFKKKYRL